VRQEGELLPQRGRTETVDLAGKMVIPGLIDSHSHPLSASLVEFDHVIPPTDSVQDVLDYFAARAKVVPEGASLVLRQVFITRLRE
jgi:predicted amidohydrolase YtcJ